MYYILLSIKSTDTSYIINTDSFTRNKKKLQRAKIREHKKTSNRVTIIFGSFYDIMNFTNSLRTRHLWSASTRLSSLLSTRRTSKTCSPGIVFFSSRNINRHSKKIYFSLPSVFPNVSNLLFCHLSLNVTNISYLIKLVRGVQRGGGGGCSEPQTLGLPNWRTTMVPSR